MTAFIPARMSAFAFEMTTSGGSTRDLWEAAIEDETDIPLTRVDTDKPVISFCEVKARDSFDRTVEELYHTAQVLLVLKHANKVTVATSHAMAPETMTRIGIKLVERDGCTNPLYLNSEEFKRQLRVYRGRAFRAWNSADEMERKVNHMADKQSHE